MLAVLGRILSGPRQYGKLRSRIFRPLIDCTWGHYGPDTKVAILAYCEDIPEQVDEIEPLQRELESKGIRVIHPVEIGRRLGDKRLTRRLFSGFPPLVESGGAFVNSVTGSGGGEMGEADAANYCTEYVDTSFTYKGRKWYWAIRAQMVGSDVYYLRARVGTRPSVHYATASSDEGAIRRATEMMADYPALEKAREVGDILGLGFWSLDMLPGERLYISEAGIKWHTTVIPPQFRGCRIPGYVMSPQESARMVVQSLLRSL